MARDKSSILTATDKKQIAATLKLQIKDAKTSIREATSAVKAIEKEFKAKLNAATKVAAAREKEAAKLQAKLEALSA